MADILISKFTTQIPRVGATPATPGFAESEGQDPVAPSGTPQVYTPVTIGSPANGLSISGTQVLTIGLASTSTTGALSSTDWNTFNGKLNLTSPITGYTVGANTALAATDTILQAFGKVQGQINARISGTIASGQVAFGTGVNTVGGDAGFTYDSANDRFTIGGASLFGNNNIDFISSATSQIYATSNTGVAEPFQVLGNLVIAPRTNASLSTYFVTNNGSNINWRWRIISSGILESRESNSIVTRTGNLNIRSDAGNGSIIISPNGTGGVTIGPSTTPTNTLDVNGTARIRTISNLGTAATSVLVPSATGVISLRTLAELASDMGAVLTSGNQTISGIKTFQEIVLPTLSNNSNLKVGSLEFQSFAINNSWFGDNLFFNGTAFQRRSTGFGSLFYFAPGGEGQFRLYNTAAAGSTISGFLCQMKVNFNGVFVAGGTGISEIANTYTGATFRADSNGVTIGLNGGAPTSRLDVRGAGTTTGLTVVIEDSAGTNNAEFVDNGQIRFLRLPTSSAGLAAGSLWNDNGTVRIGTTVTFRDEESVKTTASADQTLPSGTLTILDYDTTLLNNSTATYTVGTTGRITINTTGVYTITAGVVIEADAVTALESAFLGIFRNGDLVAISSINTTIAAGAQSGLSTSTILSLTATDIIDCRALVNSVGGVANGLARRLGTLLGANATQVNSLSITKNSM